MGKYTIRDIADLAGVSRSTVSLVINDSPQVNEKTRDRVLAVINEVGYRPSAQARGLARRRASAVGLIIPHSEEVFRNFYLADTLGGALSVLSPRQYDVLVQEATPQFIASREYETLFEEQRLDGAIIIGAQEVTPLVTAMRDIKRPVVLVNARADGFSSACADNEAGARLLARHLIALGHDDLAIIEGAETIGSAQERSRGFLEEIEQAGLTCPVHRRARADLSEFGGYRAAEVLLRAMSHPPKAIFAVNDMMAIGAIQRIQEAGFSVPNDIAVAGADDVLLSSYVRPALTTVRHSMAALSATAAEILLQRIENPRAPIVQHQSQTPLIIRESCGAQLRPG